MDSYIKDLYKNIKEQIPAGTVDFSRFSFMQPWDIGLMCLRFIEQQATSPDAMNIVLPENHDLLCYLKRMHLPQFLDELGLGSVAAPFHEITITEHPRLSVQEILHCRYHDDFNGRLGRFEQMFRSFGLNDADAKRAVVIIGELGNNVFDHNLGNWPTNFSGSIIAAQHYARSKRIQVIVGDAGVGFLGSLHNAFPDLQNDVDAIRTGLEGNTGRIGEKRGNGLKTVQQWTINNFHGVLTIHSGSGLVQVDEHGIEAMPTIPILGTLAQFMIYYE